MPALLWAGRGLSTSARTFQWSTHEHEATSVVLARRWGVPSGRCHARCALHAGRALLFFLQRRCVLDAPQRATRFSPTPDPRAEPRRAVKLCAPSSDTFQVGPKDMGNA